MEEEEEEELAWLGHVKSSVVSNSIFHSESSSLYVSCLIASLLADCQHFLSHIAAINIDIMLCVCNPSTTFPCVK